MFERILIPLDGSPRAELILGQVAKILRRKDSEILLLRVLDSPKESRRERIEAQEYIHLLAGRLALQGVRAQGCIAEGPAAPTILEQAAREEATMIAMTTHGRTGISRWLVGSVAEKIVRGSPVPVLLLRSFRPTPLGDLQATTAQELSFRKILVPTDGSPEAETVLAPAVELAQLFDSRVMVLHAEPPMMIPGYTGEMGFLPSLPPTPSEKDPVTEPAAEALCRLGLPSCRRTVAGDAAGAILDQAHSEGVDLIAMATHGRSGFSRWILGSVAERVLRHADTPLLLVRAQRESEPVAEELEQLEGASRPT